MDLYNDLKCIGRPAPRQFKKCKSATFTLDGTEYVIGKSKKNADGAGDTCHK